MLFVAEYRCIRGLGVLVQGPDTGLVGVSLQSRLHWGWGKIGLKMGLTEVTAVRERVEYMTCIFSGVREFGNGNTPGRKLN